MCNRHVRTVLAFSLMLLAACAKSPQSRLHSAALANDPQAAAAAIADGAQVTDEEIIRAVESGDFAVAKTMVELGAKYRDVKDRRGKTVFLPCRAFWAYQEEPTSESAILEFLQYLVAKGMSESEKTETLICAIGRGCRKVVHYLILNASDLDMRESTRRYTTPLLQAINGGHEDIAMLLIEKGADLHVADERGLTPLKAAQNKKLRELSVLISEKLFDFDESNQSGKTRLMHAAECGMTYLVEKFLMEGDDVNAADIDGNTPLMYAAKGGDIEIVNSLLGKGADRTRVNKFGQSVIGVAMREAFSRSSQQQYEIAWSFAVDSDIIKTARLLEVRPNDASALRDSLAAMTRRAVSDGSLKTYTVARNGGIKVHSSSYANMMVYTAEAVYAGERKLVILKLTFTGGEFTWGFGGYMEQVRSKEPGRAMNVQIGDNSSVWIYDAEAPPPTSAWDGNSWNAWHDDNADKLEEAGPVLAIVWYLDTILPPEKVYVLGDGIFCIQIE